MDGNFSEAQNSYLLKLSVSIRLVAERYRKRVTRCLRAFEAISLNYSSEGVSTFLERFSEPILIFSNTGIAETPALTWRTTCPLRSIFSRKVPEVLLPVFSCLVRGIAPPSILYLIILKLPIKFIILKREIAVGERIEPHSKFQILAT